MIEFLCQEFDHAVVDLPHSLYARDTPCYCSSSGKLGCQLYIYRIRLLDTVKLTRSESSYLWFPNKNSTLTAQSTKQSSIGKHCMHLCSQILVLIIAISSQIRIIVNSSGVARPFLMVGHSLFKLQNSICDYP